MLPIERQEWLRYTTIEIAMAFEKKYQKGMAEHKSDLSTISDERLIDEMIAESLDQLAYAMEMKRRIKLPRTLVEIFGSESKKGGSGVLQQ